MKIKLRELDFDENIHLGGNEFYGQVVDYNQFEINQKIHIN